MHISARAEDLKGLVNGIVAYDERVANSGIDPVVLAAAISFGFVYIHPFEDGNGRLHRWLIHHVLAVAGYNPAGVVFPVSAAIYRENLRYTAVLESYSRPLLEFIEWEPTPEGNVRVLNDTADYYRYLDATAHAEFLYGCVELRRPSTPRIHPRVCAWESRPFPCRRKRCRRFTRLSGMSTIPCMALEKRS